MRTRDDTFDIFLVAPPGLEPVLAQEAQTKGFKRARAIPGGVTVRGTWHDVWRANLWLRGASRVIARIGSFKTTTLPELEARARDLDWASVLRRDVSITVEATCRRSRLYHSGAVAERVGAAIRASCGVVLADGAPVTVMARLEEDECVLGVDTSGDLLHKRGFKTGVARAPLRETMAALFLRQCGYDGREPVLDPMCGSGTFVMEAAEIAAGLNPGRARSFAFEQLATFDATAWQAMRGVSRRLTPVSVYYGRDRDEACIAQARANADRAGLAAVTHFACHSISELQRPDGPPGLVVVNPPYGTRLGDKSKLAALYHTLGDVLKSRFAGWRVGLVTADKSLAYAAALPFLAPDAPVPHGGLRVTLFRTDPLP